MDIKYVKEGIGEMTLNSLRGVDTETMSYNQTIYFHFTSLYHDDFEEFSLFLDEKVRLAEIEPGGNAIILIRRSPCNKTKCLQVEHIITLVAARILTCSTLYWSFIEDEKIPESEYRALITLPINTTASFSNEELFQKIAQNARPAISSQHEVQTVLWQKILKWLRIKRK